MQEIMTGYLFGEEGTLNGTILTLQDHNEWILGRDPEEATIVLKDPSVSRKHLLCKKTEQGFFVENLSTVNPITIDGHPVQESTLLQEGTKLRIGDTTFRFSLHSH